MSKVLLCILDGFGISKDNSYNAISAASTPFLDEILQNKPYSEIETSGSSVGLPDGQMGNSEVGHMAIGSGRIILQDLPKISHAVQTKAINTNKVILDLISKFSGTNKTIHVMGLLSDGGVHSHIEHFDYIATLLKLNNVKIATHVFLDGRDTPPKSALEYIEPFADKHEISSISGRFYAMDRDKRWERVELAYKAIVEANADYFTNPKAAIEQSYENNINDEFFVPKVNQNYKGIEDGDGFIIINFRADRVRQICHALIDTEFSGFTRSKVINFAAKIGMMEYSDVLKRSMHSLFPNEDVRNTLPQVIAENNLTQLRIAETEKYAHVTFFFNGGSEKLLPGEERILVPSPKVSTYDEMPEMSAYEVTEKITDSIPDKNYDFIVVNYANCDMVGHSGNFSAAVKAVEAIDRCIESLCTTALKHNYTILITADHGNVEQMLDNGSPHTAHTLNPVPLILLTLDAKLANFSLKNGRLCDIAPTVLEIMNIKQPNEMTGHSLIARE